MFDKPIKFPVRFGVAPLLLKQIGKTKSQSSMGKYWMLYLSTSLILCFLWQINKWFSKALSSCLSHSITEKPMGLMLEVGGIMLQYWEICQSWTKICCLHCLSTKVVQLLKDLAHEENTGNEMVCNSKWLVIVVVVVVVSQQQGNQNVCKHWEICQHSWGTTVEIVRDFCIDTREICVLKLLRFCMRTREIRLLKLQRFCVRTRERW
jgi:hypothetical protein